jgi:hypothetical protein
MIEIFKKELFEKGRSLTLKSLHLYTFILLLFEPFVSISSPICLTNEITKPTIGFKAYKFKSVW